MRDNPENKSIAGAVIGGTAVCLLMLSPFFNKAVQAVDSFTAPEPSNVVSQEDLLGREGYNFLESQGYGHTKGNDGVTHITRDEVFLNNPQDASAGGTATYLATYPGTLAFQKVTVRCPAGDPAKFSSSQNCKIVDSKPSSYSPQSFG